MITITPSANKIELGRQGENEVRQVVFDLSEFIETYGEGTATLLHQRSQDSAPYNCTTSQDDTELTWTLTSTDTAFSGSGVCELRWTVDDALAKSALYSTEVIKSLAQEAEIPDPYESWYDAMVEYIDENSISPAELADAIEDYIEDHPLEAPVTSVNGETGAVVLDIPAKTSDLDNDSGFITDAGVTSFNGSTGAVTYTAPVSSVNGDTGAVTISVPTKTSDLQNDSGFVTDAGVTTFNGQTGAVTYSAPVSSVNGQTGAVTISVPSKTSELTNDSGFLTSAPVTSVNGATGAVVIATATTSAAGLMSAEDKTRLDALYADYSSALTALGVS